MRKALTDRYVASVKPVRNVAQVDVFDLGYSGLALRVGHRDKVWTFHHRDNGKLRRMKLGRYPEMTLAEAREAWRLARKALAQGIVLRGGTPNRQLTADIVAQWLDAWRRDKRPNTVKAVERQLNFDVLPAWGKRDLASITKHDVLS